jgi:hypothetical protein
VLFSNIKIMGKEDTATKSRRGRRKIKVLRGKTGSTQETAGEPRASKAAGGT